MAPRKKAEEAPAPKTRKKAATAPMAADTTTSTPGNPTVCKTCNGHGATDIVPMNARNAEAHYNKYNQSLRLGVGGGSHMGATCPSCSGGGFGR
jgi:DnaJ-class molecular chaperone